MTIRDQITALCQNATMSDKDLVIAIESEISKLIPFDHKHHNKMDACGITEDISMQIAGSGTFSELVEMVEKSNPKRILAYIFTREMLDGRFNKRVPSTRSTAEDLDGEVSKFLSGILGSRTAHSAEESIQSRCDEEDTSECYKCPINKVCTKFKN